MIKDVAPDVVRWVQEGERLFGLVLHTLHGHEALLNENQRMHEEMRAIREELDQLRAERIEAAETLKTFAEHVTQLATLALQRLARRSA